MLACESWKDLHCAAIQLLTDISKCRVLCLQTSPKISQQTVTCQRLGMETHSSSFQMLMAPSNFLLER